MEHDLIVNNDKKTGKDKNANVKIIFTRFGTIIGFVGICIIFGVLSPVFFTISNIMDVVRQISILGIISFGLTFPMVTKRFDVSIGYLTDLVSVIVAGVLAANLPIPVAILAGLLVGSAVGLLNGFLVAYVGISDFIGTLATGGICTGIVFMYTKGYPITQGMSKPFLQISEGHVGIISVPVIILMLVFILYYLLLYNCKPGRYLYAIGGNQEAAMLSGINSKLHILGAFVLCGLSVAVSAVILTARLASGQPVGGTGFTMDAIAAVFIGMTTFKQGEANLPGTFLGVLLIGILNNGLTLLNVEYYIQDILKGIIILAAVTITAVQNARRQH